MALPFLSSLVVFNILTAAVWVCKSKPIGGAYVKQLIGLHINEMQKNTPCNDINYAVSACTLVMTLASGLSRLDANYSCDEACWLLCSNAKIPVVFVVEKSIKIQKIMSSSFHCAILFMQENSANLIFCLLMLPGLLYYY